MYSTGLPIMYFLAAVFYFIFFWIYKGLLIKYYEKTTKFNEELPIYAHSWVEGALILHGIVGAFMISNYDLLPHSSNSLTEAVSSYNFDSGSILANIQSRFLDTPYTIIYSFFWVCVIVWLLFMDTVIDIVFKILAWIMFRIKGVIISNKEELVRANAFSQDFYKEILPAPLENMKIRNEVAKKAF